MTNPAVAHRLSFTVFGDPEPGGSKSGFAIYRGSAAKGTREFTGRVAIADTNKHVARWRALVRQACRPHGRPLIFPCLDGPLVVRFMFTLHRPESVKLNRRPYPSVKPDCSKLVRGTEDEITQAGLWRDDARIVSELISKAYAGNQHADGTPALDVPGCVVDIFEIMV